MWDGRHCSLPISGRRNFVSQRGSNGCVISSMSRLLIDHCCCAQRNCHHAELLHHCSCGPPRLKSRTHFGSYISFPCKQSMKLSLSPLLTVFFPSFPSLNHAVSQSKGCHTSYAALFPCRRECTFFALISCLVAALCCDCPRRMCSFRRLHAFLS